MKDSKKLQGFLFELTLIFLVLSNLALFSESEVGSYGNVFKIISIMLLAVLILHLGYRIGKK